MSAIKTLANNKYFLGAKLSSPRVTAAKIDEIIDRLNSISTEDGQINVNLEFSAGKSIVFEGTTDDAFEVTLAPGDPTADRTITLPDLTGTVLLVTGMQNPQFTNVDAGASGTAGTVDIFPTTAAKGKIQIVAADSAGDTTTTITNASQAAARTYTIPDAGGNGNFVITNGIGATQGARCTAQFDATSGTTGTTLTAVAGLTVNVQAAGVYAFRAYIQGISTANSGLKLAISGTATATSINYTGSQFNDATCGDTSSTTTLGNAVAAATAVYNYAFIEGVIVVNAAGTLLVQAAQNASHADTTSVYVNSSFTVTRIA